MGHGNGVYNKISMNG